MRVFCNISDFQVNYMLYWRFHNGNEIPAKSHASICIFTQWIKRYILDFGPWMWSALNMGFVDKWSSRMQGQWVFEWATIFIWVQKTLIFRTALNPPPPKSSLGGGVFFGPQTIICCMTIHPKHSTIWLTR